MRDKSNDARVAGLHPKIREVVKTLIEKAEEGFPKNIAIRIVQAYRTFAEQNHLYALGRTEVNPDGRSASKPYGNIVTNARGGSSYHNYALAIDFAILYDKDGNGTYETLSWDMVKDMDRDGQADWMEVVKVFEASPGCKWGGRWHSIVDNPHFQWSFGYTESQLLAKYNVKQVDANGYVIV